MLKLNSFLKKIANNRGATMVEYGLLVAGVALVSAASVSLMGHQTTDLYATTAAIMPGAHADDNNAIASGKLIETSLNDGALGLDVQGILDASDTARLETNLGFEAGTLEGLVTEVGEEDEG